MTPCDDLAAALGRGDPLSDGLRTHAGQCPGCAALVHLDDHLGHAAERSRPLEPSAALRTVMAGVLAPTARYSALRRAVGPVTAAVAVALAVLALHPRSDLAGQSSPWFWAQAAVWLVATVTAVALVLTRGRSGLGIAPVARWSFAAAVAVLFELLAVWATRAVPGSVTDPAVVGLGMHLHCVLVGSGFAAVVLAVLLGVGRRSAAVSPVSAGLAAGIAAGLAGALGLQLVCPVAVPVHVALGHGGAILVAAVIGTLAGRRVLAP